MTNQRKAFLDIAMAEGGVNNLSRTRAALEYCRAFLSPDSKVYQMAVINHQRNVDRQRSNMDQAHLTGL